MRWTREARVKTAIPSPSLGMVVGKPLVPPVFSELAGEELGFPSQFLEGCPGTRETLSPGSQLAYPPQTLRAW